MKTLTVEFLKNHRGLWKKGEIAELEIAHARALIDAGTAKETKKKASKNT